jgi:hypothetical protein
LALSGHDEIRLDLGQRAEDESPLVEPGMRDPEARLVDLLFPVDEQIEIERPRSLGRDSRPVAAEAGLDGEEEVEERPRRQLGLERKGTVQEARLIQKAHRLRIDQRGDADHLDARRCGKLCDR